MENQPQASNNPQPDQQTSDPPPAPSTDKPVVPSSPAAPRDLKLIFLMGVVFLLLVAAGIAFWSIRPK